MKKSLFYSGSSSTSSISISNSSSDIELNSQRTSTDNFFNTASILHRRSIDNTHEKTTAPIPISHTPQSIEKVKSRRKTLINERKALEKIVLCYFFDEAKADDLLSKKAACITEIYSMITLDNKQSVRVEQLSAWRVKYFPNKNMPQDLIENIQELLEINNDIGDATVLIQEVDEQQPKTFLSM